MTLNTQHMELSASDRYVHNRSAPLHRVDAPVRIIAHRCCAGEFPENTVAAATACAGAVDAIEIDLRQSVDGTPIVFHDATLERLTSETGPVNTKTSTELRQLTIGSSGCHIPTFREMVRALPAEMQLNVELKERGLGRVVAWSQSLPQDIIWSSFDHHILQEVHAADPTASTALLYANSPSQNLQTAIDLGCSHVHPHHKLCRASVHVEDAQAAGLGVNAWTVRHRTTWEQLHIAGVDGAITDYRPGKLPGRDR